MRDIKFRAWDKKYGWTLPGTQVNEGKIPIHQLNDVGSRDGLEVMQYTSRKDKNGIDIYEGDVIHDGIRQYIVRWSDEHAGLLPFADNDYDGQTIVRIQDVKVIGNIYENPELLK